MRPGCFGLLCCWGGRRRQVDSWETSSVSKRSNKSLQNFANAGLALTESQKRVPLVASAHTEHPVCKDTIQEEASDQPLDTSREEGFTLDSDKTCADPQHKEPQEGQSSSEDSSSGSSQELSLGARLECTGLEQSKSFDPRDCMGTDNSLDLSETSVKSVKKSRGILQLFRKSSIHGPNNEDQQPMSVVPNSCECVAKTMALADGEIQLTGQRESSAGKGRLKKSLSFPALQWMLKSARHPQSPQTASNEDPHILERPMSVSSAPAGDSENEFSLRLETRGSRGFPCFWWNQSLQREEGDHDEIIINPGVDDDHELTPPGLVGLQNLGNTCFLNTALQCLRCTPRLAELVVPELENGFRDDIQIQLSLDSEDSFVWKRGIRSFSVPHNLDTYVYEGDSLFKANSSEQLCTDAPLDNVSQSVGENANDSRSTSLPTALPSYSDSHWYADDMGLVGGSCTRLTNDSRIWKAAKEIFQTASGGTSIAPSAFAQRENCATISNVHSETSTIHVTVELLLLVNDIEGSAGVKLLLKYGELLGIQTCDEISNSGGIIPAGVCSQSKSEAVLSKASRSAEVKISGAVTPSGSSLTPRVHEAGSTEKILGEDFIAAFRKTMLATCMLPAETSFNPKSLFKRLARLPMGDIYCDGGQHDCKEILEVLLNLLHDQLKSCAPSLDHAAAMALPADPGNEDDDGAEGLWMSYLERNCSPITDLFAGQLQIVRTCQKCTSKTMTYEPFWELSLPLQKEKTGWFGGRGPSTLEDLLRAFTSGEILQGDNSPFCEICGQKTPASRRMRIHRFPSILILHIKRFKHTLRGREKLTAAITYPLRDLKLESFGSSESKIDSSSSCSYNLYASSNHFGTLSGGHYTATCKVKDQNKREGWYLFNDQTVMRVSEDDVVSPNAYVLFYAKKRQKSHSQ